MHIFFTSTAAMLLARIPLAVGEAGTFPAAIAATNEWFPKKERAFAIGIFTAGSNVGAILKPLIVPVIAVTMGWRWAFILPRPDDRRVGEECVSTCSSRGSTDT